jgi:hypothetical protein
MFDFNKWREWLKAKAEVLRGDGFVTEWKPHDQHLRATSLAATGNSRIGSFRSFENGLVDYEIMDTATKNWIANEAMIRVDDRNFAEVYEQFADCLKTKSDH